MIIIHKASLSIQRLYFSPPELVVNKQTVELVQVRQPVGQAMQVTVDR